MELRTFCLGPLHGHVRNITAMFVAFLSLRAVISAQQVAAFDIHETEDEVIKLSPFEVTAEANEGYNAVTTLVGNRLNTDLRDIGNAVQVVTSQFLADVAATGNQTLLQYTTGTEVGGTEGNFAGVGNGSQLLEDLFNPDANTRIRGLSHPDNTRDLFLSEIPWDSYNVERLEIQRGPNSILFGMGSPAGVINAGLKSAIFDNFADVEFGFDNQGSLRGSLDFNEQLIDGRLALRLALLRDEEKFRQVPAFERDQRLFAALRWEPHYSDSTRTIVRANFERGEIIANQPHVLPPEDFITPWFNTGTYTVPDGEGGTRTYAELDRQTFNPFLARDAQTGRPTSGVAIPVIQEGPRAGAANPAFNPWVGGFANGGGPYFNVGSAAGAPANLLWSPTSSRGINSSGGIDGSIGGFPYQTGPVGIQGFSEYASAADLPMAVYGIYKNKQLTDPTIFDFYRNLIEGPNKEETQHFRVWNVSLAQTFLDDQVGMEFALNRETYDVGRLGLHSWTANAIHVDIMEILPDGTNTGTGTPPDNTPFGDGTPNPNVGRPYVVGTGPIGSGVRHSEREGERVTAFLRHDFAHGRVGSTLTRLLGRHVLTGLYAREKQDIDDRAWYQYLIEDESYREFMGLAPNDEFNAGVLIPDVIAYLGPSLLDRTSASGAGILGIRDRITLTSGTVRAFDSTWGHSLDPTAPDYVDPAAPWIDYRFLPPALDYPDFDLGNPGAMDEKGNLLWPDRRQSKQSENPANYVGWVDVPYTLTNVTDSAEARDRLTARGGLKRSQIKTEALFWQGHFWDNALVGTFGWRRDAAETRQRDWWWYGSEQPRGHLDLGTSYRLPEEPDHRLTIKSHSYSIVAHLDQLPWLADLMREWPVRVSVFYNRSANSRPEAFRVNLFGDPIPPPTGLTHDRGLLVESRDGRFSIRINQYDTRMENATTDIKTLTNVTYVLGDSQSIGAAWANVFEYDLNAYAQGFGIDAQVNNRPPGAPNPPGYVATYRPGNPDFNPNFTLYNYGVDFGETLEQAQVREAAAVAAWREWQASVDPRYYEAWGIDVSERRSPFWYSEPEGFAITEDNRSEGYEIELSAQPLSNWRLMINASRTRAVRSKLGDESLSEFISAYENALYNTAAGDLRVWWGGPGADTTLKTWNNEFGTNWAQYKLQEGTTVPELRKWRVNVITNYEFTGGTLNGFSFGGAVRWQDDVTIGYPPVAAEVPSAIRFDFDHPYRGPSETNIDFWIGYHRRLAKKVDWSIQLNVRNAFAGDELIPVTVQPDGTPAGYRIAPSQTWTVTNRFHF